MTPEYLKGLQHAALICESISVGESCRFSAAIMKEYQRIALEGETKALERGDA